MSKKKVEQQSLPILFPPSRIACGLKHTVAVTDSGMVFTWGSDQYGQLGSSDIYQNNQRNMPQQRKSIKDLTGVPIQIATGAYNTMMLVIDADNQDECGQIYAWGLNENGWLGVETSKKQGQESSNIEENPKLVLISTKEKMRRVFCGPNYSASISETGMLYTWGNGIYGNLGHDGTDSKKFPTVVQFSKEKQCIMAACGAKHMLAVTKDKILYSWGNGANGRLGHGDSKGCVVPKPVASFTNKEVSFVSCGEAHSCAIILNGDLYTWGHGSYYRLGHGDDADVFEPKAVEILLKKRCMMIASGLFHNLVNTTFGQVYAWGSSQYGKLGLLDIDDTNSVTTPRLINRLEGTKINQVAVGKYHSICVSTNGEVFVWGHHGDQRLGIKSKSPEPFPFKLPGVDGVSGGKMLERANLANKSRSGGGDIGGGQQEQSGGNIFRICQVGCGSQHNIAITAGGDLWSWGERENGALGLADDSKKSDLFGGGENLLDVMEPQFLISANMQKVSSISCGARHSLAVTFSGEVFAWGNGNSGQLGVGSTIIIKIPTLIESLQGKRVVLGCCGENFSACINDQGEVFTWGDAEVGKLGLGQNVTNQYYPRQIFDIVPMIRIAAGTGNISLNQNQILENF